MGRIVKRYFRIVVFLQHSQFLKTRRISAQASLGRPSRTINSMMDLSVRPMANVSVINCFNSVIIKKYLKLVRIQQSTGAHVGVQVCDHVQLRAPDNAIQHQHYHE